MSRKLIGLIVFLSVAVIASACSDFDEDEPVEAIEKEKPVLVDDDEEIIQTNDQEAELIEALITIGGEERFYMVLRPTSAPNQPLVIDMHGWGGEAYDQVEGSGLAEQALEHNFTILYPQATDEHRLWSPDDVVYIEALLDLMAEEYAIDQSRVYATGGSAGGVMANYIGAVLSERIAAIAPVMGLMPVFPEMNDLGGAIPEAAEIVDFDLPPDPPRAVPVMMLHGVDDQVVPFEGAERSLVIWAEFNDCDPDGNLYEQAGFELPSTVHENCEDNVFVGLLSYNAGHDYPENPGPVIWEFLSQYSL